MRKILFIIYASLAISAKAQHTITLTRTAPDNNSDWLHKIANEFSDSVGKALKMYYPSEIEFGTLFVDIESNGSSISLTYSATIIPTDGEHAIYYFDHRGALSANKISNYACDDAKERTWEQVGEFHDKVKAKYGKEIYSTTYSNDFTNYNGMNWAINEQFFSIQK